MVGEGDPLKLYGAFLRKMEVAGTGKGRTLQKCGLPGQGTPRHLCETDLVKSR